MERIGRRKAVGAALGVALALASLSANAGTVMLPPPTGGESAAPEFPPSRFGMPPIKANTGLSDHYAARETEAYDELPSARDWDRSASYGARWEGGERSIWDERSGAGGGRRLASASPGPGTGEAATPTPEAQELEIRRKGVQEIALIANDLGYFPKTIFVTRDIPVRLFVTGASKSTLCLMMDSFAVRKQVKSQKVEEITFTPSVPGQYRFYCPLNGTEGTLVVKELAGG
jgi:hypothetical protein